MKCPKCNTEMTRADNIPSHLGAAARLLKFGDTRGDKIIPFYCANCGYIELYNEKYLRKQ
jgi:predicted nucleic-acid-binding Zn-ribbon protein